MSVLTDEARVLRPCAMAGSSHFGGLFVSSSKPIKAAQGWAPLWRKLPPRSLTSNRCNTRSLPCPASPSPEIQTVPRLSLTVLNVCRDNWKGEAPSEPLHGRNTCLSLAGASLALPSPRHQDKAERRTQHENLAGNMGRSFRGS